MVEIKKLKSIETDEYSLEVYRCPNGFHIGLDASYLDQVSDIDVATLCNGITREPSDKKEVVLKVVKQFLDNAPASAKFGIVDDIESEDEVLQIFY